MDQIPEEEIMLPQTQEEEDIPPKPPEDDDDGDSILIPILVALLITVGLVTAALFAYIFYVSSVSKPVDDPADSTSQAQSSQPQKTGQAVTGTSSHSVRLSQSSAQDKDKAPSTSSQSRKGTSSTSGGSWGEDSTTNEITSAITRTAYWTADGKSYHFSSSCPSLSRSSNIQNGTLKDAIDAGKTDPCNNCANGR